MDTIADLLLALLEKVTPNIKKARTQIIVDILVVAALLLLIGCGIWTYMR